jgi:hypothetical protein
MGGAGQGGAWPPRVAHATDYVCWKGLARCALLIASARPGRRTGGALMLYATLYATLCVARRVACCTDCNVSRCPLRCTRLPQRERVEEAVEELAFRSRGEPLVPLVHRHARCARRAARRASRSLAGRPSLDAAGRLPHDSFARAGDGLPARVVSRTPGISAGANNSRRDR